MSELLAHALDQAIPGLGEFSDLFIDVAEWAVMKGVYLPNTTAEMSYKYDTYVPDTQPAFSIHWKLNITFYNEANFQGVSTNETIYEGYYYG